MQPSTHRYRELSTMAALMALIMLLLHFYYYCYTAFAQWRLTAPIIDKIVANLAHAGIYRHLYTSKIIALFCVALTTMNRPSTARQPRPASLIARILAGLILYIGSGSILVLSTQPQQLAIGYISISLLGLALLYSCIGVIASIIQARLTPDVFNRYGESFPQEERQITNDYSINLRACYTYRNQVRDSYINFIDIFRGTLVMGTPGSGKTRYIFREFIRQSLANGMALFVYDLKYDDLTRLTYHALQELRDKTSVPLQFYCINFDDLSRSHRCNPLHPTDLADITDAAESARTILLALNKKWIHQQGDFFVESAVNFFTANIWFLRQYEDGRYCTLPHLIELIQTDYNKLFSILRSYPEIETLIQSFVSAYVNNTMEQLQGQIDSARIPLSALASPQLYYILSANDCRLDINNPDQPKVVCIGSNPQKQHVYGAIVSLYVSRMLKQVNRKGGVPCHLLFDEFVSFYAGSMDHAVSTARSNRVAITLGIQDLSQVRKEYGHDHADALFNLPGNLITGKVTGDSAQLVSAQFGKILQEKSTISTNSRDTSTSQTHHLDLAVPASKISTLSSGEFAGFIADSPAQPIRLKGFHCRVIPDHAALERDDKNTDPIPEIRTVDRQVVDLNFKKIKEDVGKIVQDRLSHMQNTPGLAQLIVKKREGLSRKPSH